MFVQLLHIANLICFFEIDKMKAQKSKKTWLGTQERMPSHVKIVFLQPGGIFPG